MITAVTLELAENVRIKRTDRRMALREYAAWFRANVRDSADVVFHNADLYPNEYDRVNAVSYTRTDEPVTVPERLIPLDQGYRKNRVGYWVVSTLWGGEELREHVVDPLLFRGEPVSWRNHEASYDVAELEPASREDQTYVLQEYFVPVARLEAFVDSMGRIFRAHDANVINVSIRHAMPDPGTLLAWAPEEVFALVVYYKQSTDDDSRAAVGQWTRELVDAVLAEGGRYYLPYQLHATEAQFTRAYPRSGEFFALKRRLDPTNKFRNALWDKYYLPRVDPTAAISNDARAVLDTIDGYRRPVSQTFLANPEWYIVYSSEEYAAWMRDRHPTRFPYLTSIGQYWEHWREMRRAVAHKAPSTDYQVMLGVIGVSYTAEFMLKGLYENTVGRVTGWTAGGRLSAEDSLAYRVATDYAAFLHDAPWYRYDFVAELGVLWGDVPIFGRPFIRKLERRAFLTVEFGVKAVYGAMIGWATGATSSSQAAVVGVVVSGAPEAVARAGAHPSVQRVIPLDGVHTLIQVERYRKFREWVVAMAADSVAIAIAEIAGNAEIVITGAAPAGWRLAPGAAEQMYSIPLPVDATRERFTLRAPVRALLGELRRIRGEVGVTLVHLYDY